MDSTESKPITLRLKSMYLNVYIIISMPKTMSITQFFQNKPSDKWATKGTMTSLCTTHLDRIIKQKTFTREYEVCKSIVQKIGVYKTESLHTGKGTRILVQWESIVGRSHLK